MTLLTTALTTHESPRLTHGQNPNSKTLMFLDPPSASVDLSTFSKISLNTSKPSKGKIVQNVKAHNFAVDWHLKFEEILGEKCF
jgi:hypothetical protein